MKYFLMMLVLFLSFSLLAKDKPSTHLDIDLGFVPQFGRAANKNGEVRNTFSNTAIDFSMGLSFSFISTKAKGIKGKIKYLKTGISFISPKRFALTLTPVSAPISKDLYLSPMIGVGGDSGLEPFVLFCISYEIF